MDMHLVVAMGEVEGDVGVVEEIVGEPFLDVLLFVAGTDDEVVVAVEGVFLHDMPEDGHASDFDHRFWFENRFLGNARAKATGE
jgi:hypothetical protein